MIIRGGFNVYPREIEEVIYEHPDVAEAALIGLPHDDWARRSAPRSSSSRAPRPPPRRSRRSSSSASRPTSTRGWCGLEDALPKGPTGKILQREIEPPAMRT